MKSLPSICGIPANLAAKRLYQLRRAFTLIEVLLAIGIIAVALVGILSVSSVSLNLNKESHETSMESLVAKSLPGFFQNANSSNGTNSWLAYSNASNWATISYSNIFAYSVTNNGTNSIIITTNSTLPTAGRLFRVTLRANAIVPTTNNAAMGVRVSIQAVPNTTTVPPDAPLPLVYDSVILP